LAARKEGGRKGTGKEKMGKRKKERGEEKTSNFALIAAPQRSGGGGRGEEGRKGRRHGDHASGFLGAQQKKKREGSREFHFLGWPIQ